MYASPRQSIVGTWWLRLAVFVIFLPCFLCEVAGAGEQYAFLVACRQYSDPALNPLNYSEQDAVNLKRRLMAVGYQEANIVLLTQTLGAQNASLLPLGKNIRLQLANLLKIVKADDTVLIAFSGHGVQLPGNPEAFYCPMDADVKKSDTLLSLTRLMSTLNQHEAQVRILLVDACRDNLAGVNNQLPQPKLNAVANANGNANREGGIASFVSCSAGERSFESDKLKAGVFFHFVNEALKGDADRDGDSKVTLSEVEDYVITKVSNFTKNDVPQTPELKKDTRGAIVLADLQKMLPVGMDAQVNKWLARRVPCQIETSVDGVIRYRCIDLLLENFQNNTATGVVYQFDQRVGTVTIEIARQTATVQIVIGNYGLQFDLTAEDIVVNPEKEGYAAGQTFKQARLFKTKSGNSAIVLIDLPPNSAMLRSVLQPAQFNRWGFTVETMDVDRDYALVDGARKMLTPLQIGNGVTFSVADICANGPATITGRGCVEDKRRTDSLGSLFELQVILDGDEQKPLVSRKIPPKVDKNFDFKLTIPQGTRTVSIGLTAVHGLVSYWSGMRVDW